MADTNPKSPKTPRPATRKARRKARAKEWARAKARGEVGVPAMPWLDTALYVDFETYGGGARGFRPVLVCVHDAKAGRTRQFVLDDRFEKAAKQKRLAEITPQAFARWLVLGPGRRRSVVGFSMHERTTLEQWMPGVEFEYVNALPICRAWRNRRFAALAKAEQLRINELPASERAAARRAWNSLESMLKLAGIGVPSNYGRGSTTVRLRNVEEHLLAKGSYSALPAKAKAKWVAVLKHNKTDVEGMVKLLRKVAGGVSAIG
jgi:hypothetical protein